MSMAQRSARNGGQILVSSLHAHGVDIIYGLPGESALPIFDALLDYEGRLRFVTCRHEANAAHMAEADGKMTGRPGVCIVSRGPGAMHAAIGVHTAHQNSTPMILIVGQVAREHRGLEAFQEMDFAAVFASTTKWAAEVPDAARMAEFVSRAMHVATQGRPGPVVLSVPEDVLAETWDGPDVAPFAAPVAVAPPDALERVAALLAEAERPLVMVGGAGWRPETCAAFRRFVEARDLPVVAGFRAQDILDNESASYIGDMSLGGSRKLAARLQEADLLLVIGERLGDVTTRGYTAVHRTRETQKLVHVYPGAEELGRVFPTDVSIQCGADAFVEKLVEMDVATRAGWRAWRETCRAEFVAHHTRWPEPDGLDLAAIVREMRAILPQDAIVANGAGNCNIWLHRFFGYRQRFTQVASQAGAMGYGFAGAVAAKLRFPERAAVGFGGDGCFLMASPDFATAVHHRIPVVALVCNNATYGSIRMHQERHFPQRPSGTSITNPDFARLAESYGCFGARVERLEQFAPAFRQALASDMPSIVELRLSPGQLTPDMRL